MQWCREPVMRRGSEEGGVRFGYLKCRTWPQNIYRWWISSFLVPQLKYVAPKWSLSFIGTLLHSSVCNIWDVPDSTWSAVSQFRTWADFHMCWPVFRLMIGTSDSGARGTDEGRGNVMPMRGLRSVPPVWPRASHPSLWILGFSVLSFKTGCSSERMCECSLGYKAS